MKRVIYKDSHGKIISKDEFFDHGKKRDSSYSKHLVEFPDKPKQHAPRIDIECNPEKSKSKLDKIIDQMLEDLVPFGFVWEKDQLYRIKDYSLVGKYVSYEVEKYYQGKIRYTNRDDPRAKEMEREVRSIVYNTRIKAYMDIMGISRLDAQAVYRVVNDMEHPQHDAIKDQIYGKGKK